MKGRSIANIVHLFPFLLFSIFSMLNTNHPFVFLTKYSMSKQTWGGLNPGSSICCAGIHWCIRWWFCFLHKRMVQRWGHPYRRLLQDNSKHHQGHSENSKPRLQHAAVTWGIELCYTSRCVSPHGYLDQRPDVLLHILQMRWFCTYVCKFWCISEFLSFCTWRYS